MCRPRRKRSGSSSSLSMSAAIAIIEAAFASFVQRGAGALLVGTGAFLNSHRERIVALAARHALPAIYSVREYAAAAA